MASDLCFVQTPQRIRPVNRLRTQRLQTSMAFDPALLEFPGTMTYHVHHYDVNTPVMWGFIAMVSTHVNRLKWGYGPGSRVDEPYLGRTPFDKAFDKETEVTTCPECDDLGEITCYRCMGKGFTGVSEPVQCAMCDATGFIPCIEPLCVSNLEEDFSSGKQWASRGETWEGRARTPRNPNRRTSFRTPVTANKDGGRNMARKPRRLPPSRESSRDSDYMGRPPSSANKGSDLPR